MGKICNRNYVTGGAYTVRDKDNVGYCVSCGHPISEHRGNDLVGVGSKPPQNVANPPQNVQNNGTPRTPLPYQAMNSGPTEDTSLDQILEPWTAFIHSEYDGTSLLGDELAVVERAKAAILATHIPKDAIQAMVLDIIENYHFEGHTHLRTELRQRLSERLK